MNGVYVELEHHVMLYVRSYYNMYKKGIASGVVHIALCSGGGNYKVENFHDNNIIYELIHFHFPSPLIQYITPPHATTITTTPSDIVFMFGIKFSF